MQERIRQFILGEAQDLLHGLDFNAVALSLYRWQRANNPDYDAFCANAQPEHWTEIPAVPVALYRDLPLCCFDPEQAQIVFRTSGTTGRRGVHRLCNTELYDLGAHRHAKSVVGEFPKSGLSLVSHAPDSSLGHMCDSLVPGMPRFFDTKEGLRVDAAWAALRQADQAVFVPMTGLAAALLMAAATEPVHLPGGSMVMVTGGFKGREVAVDAETLTQQLLEHFPGVRLVGEYGMTELSSQLWSANLGEPFVPPPWMRVVAVDPWTAEPAETGLLRFIDLANHQTVVAIETRDMGRVLEDGRVELLGRLPGSQVRGCSLSVEEADLRRRGLIGTTSAFEALSSNDDASHVHVSHAEVTDLETHQHSSGCDHSGHALENDSSSELQSPVLTPDDVARVERVMAALASLRRERSVELGDGLTFSQVLGGLDGAISAITRKGLAEELAAHSDRPSDVSVVVARGVFTAPLEWVALYAAAGMTVRIKAPTGAATMCEALARHFTAQRLPVFVDLDRDLSEAASIVAFGSDATISAIETQYPNTPKALFGHRFSVGVTEEVLPQVLAWEVGSFDTRGCMAPAAIFCLTDIVPHLDDLATAMMQCQRAMPRGRVEDEVGPEWRRRVGLARRLGQLREGPGWAITVLPPQYFEPVALPRMLSLIPVSGPDELARILAPWQDQLSTMGTDNLLRRYHAPIWKEIYGWFPRVVAMGQMQRPKLPRLHDGVEMLGAICSDECI